MTSTTILAEGSQSLLLPALPDLVWGTVAFVIVALSIYKLAWPTFMATLDERADKIEKGLHAADQARAEIADQRAGLEEEIRDAHRDAEQIREKAHTHAKAIMAQAQSQAHSSADQILENAQRRISADTDAARRVLRADLGILATELATRIVGESLTDQELARRVTDRFLDELEASTASSPQEA
ncbi:F0F1 ATP synthase subunit B [Arcanobacterium pinnipediorum]|uniref:ATP synthase subunit b n=1 Tax=Arcanobacterium pinnipediorum TaxID=1503041 RepID=A0ABY5AI04_9ACTO|nr:F0F1 ATP synthase subunit B [Arcanobacterium pinnipediorum]USR79717.1 F0F1 ATP synthase subunit B [Arcanobacterium pinnipediorum]